MQDQFLLKICNTVSRNNDLLIFLLEIVLGLSLVRGVCTFPESDPFETIDGTFIHYKASMDSWLWSNNAVLSYPMKN